MLSDVAFGPHPGRFPLPSSTDPVDQWRRAVALGGQGRYAQARAQLDVLQRSAAPTAIRSLAASTRASLLRQSGAHAVASGHDGAAFAIAETATTDSSLMHEARCDALTGLAADALGCGRLAAGRRLLARCGAYLDAVGDTDALWRQRVRLDWVSAEIALASGDFAAAAEHAQAAADRAGATPSVRHRVKSALLCAAAATGSDPDLAAAGARQVLEDSDRHGLLPLRWAAAMLLNGLRPAPDVREIRDESATAIARRGGRFVE